MSHLIYIEGEPEVIPNVHGDLADDLPPWLEDQSFRRVLRLENSHITDKDGNKITISIGISIIIEG